MTIDLNEKENPLINDILIFSIFILDKDKCSSVKIYKHKFYELFLDHFPIQYQRNDSITLQYDFFCKIVLSLNICSVKGIHKKNNKQIRLVRKKVNEYPLKFLKNVYRQKA